MYIVHGPLENMVYFFYRNYHIFSVVRLSYDVKNLADLRGCYPESARWLPPLRINKVKVK